MVIMAEDGHNSASATKLQFLFSDGSSKGYEKRPKYLQMSDSDIFVIHLSVQMYPVEDAVEKDLVFLKYGFCNLCCDPT